jgi:hypothetical protein
MKASPVRILVISVSLFGWTASFESRAQTPPPKKSAAVQQPADASNAGPCITPKLAVYPISPNSSGETLEGPACVQTSPVNTLRNLVFISTTITQTAGPSPASIFPASGGQNPGSGEAPAALDDLAGRVRRAQTNVRLRSDNNRVAAAKIDDLLARLKEFVSHSDESVSSGRYGALLTQIKERKTEVDQALVGGNNSWKTTDDLVLEIHATQDSWANFSVQHSDLLADAKNKGTYDALKTQLDDSETKALLQASGSDVAKAVGKNLGLLSYWSDILAGFLEPDGSISADPAKKFTVHQDVPCRSIFNTNKSVAVKLTIGDRLPFFDGQQMSSQTHDAFVTVTCTSPFSLSAGVAFSSIEQREFAIVQSAPASGSTTPVNKFGYSSKSAFHPLPLAMAHMRLWEWDSHRYAVHATFGVAANIQGSNAGGSSAEYLPGLSFSLFRTMYLTAGVHIGRQASLAGGFNVGDVVPSGITSPPLQTSYKAGAGFAVTFTKP